MGAMMAAEQGPAWEVNWESLSGRIAKDPGASTWLKTTLALALQRDPVDAANDAQVLYAVLNSRVSFPRKREEDQDDETSNS